MPSDAAGDAHCLAVTERGEVFSWGGDNFGECGHGSYGEQHLLPRRVEALAGAKTRSASAEGFHSLVITEEGALHSFGMNVHGQLGHGSVGAEHSRKMMDALRHVRIAAAAAGQAHSLLLTEDGAVFTWRLNNSGALGSGQRGRKEALPQKVEAFSGLKVMRRGCWGSQQLRRGSSRRALHVGREIRRAARARR